MAVPGPAAAAGAVPGPRALGRPRSDGAGTGEPGLGGRGGPGEAGAAESWGWWGEALCHLTCG